MSAEEFAEQLQDLLDAIQTILLKDLVTLKGAPRIDKCAYLRTRLNRAKQLHRSIVVEIRDCDDAQKQLWSERLKDFDLSIQKCLADVSWAEKSTDHEPQKSVNVDEMGTREIQQQALQVQDRTMDAVSRTKQMVEETIEIGQSTNMELKIQGEQIGRIQDNVNVIQSDLKRANNQIRIFMRRMQTDKVFLLLVFLVALGVIAAVIMSILRQLGVVKF